MAADYNITQNDHGFPIQDTLKDALGVVVNLTGATVRFQMAPLFGGAVTVNQLATIVNAAGGVVSYTWQQADTANPGSYNAQWVVVFSNAAEETFPFGGFVIEVAAEIA